MKSDGIRRNYIITGFTSTRQNERGDEIVKDAYGAYQKLYYEDKGLKDYTSNSIESIGERVGVRLR
jgi:hypothetical protein